MCAHVEGERCDVCMWEGGGCDVCMWEGERCDVCMWEGGVGGGGRQKRKRKKHSVERGREGKSTRLLERACMS